MVTITQLISSTIVAKARLNPCSLRTNPINLTPFSPKGSLAINSSTSAIWGTRLGLTKLATSILRNPASIKFEMNCNFVSVVKSSAWLCKPSLGPTSTISILLSIVFNLRLILKWTHLSSTHPLKHKKYNA